MKDQSQKIPNEEIDYIGTSSAKKDDNKMNEVEKLREENKRLKRTLLERFDQTFN